MTEAVRQGWLDAAEAERSGLLGAAVAGDTPAPEMGVRAVRTALGRWGGDISELGLLLYVEGYRCGPDGWLPQSYVMREAVGGDLLAVGVRQGCNGVFGALELAAAHLRGGGSEAALIVAADNMGSPLVDRWRASPGYLLADGAAALVLTRSAGFARLLSVNSKAVPELEALHRGTQPLDPSGSARPVPLDLGARQREFLGGDDAPKDWMLRVMKAQGELMAQTLDEAGVTAEDMTRVVTAHANRELADAWLSSLGRTLEQSAWGFGRGWATSWPATSWSPWSICSWPASSAPATASCWSAPAPAWASRQPSWSSPRSRRGHPDPAPGLRVRTPRPAVDGGADRVGGRVVAMTRRRPRRRTASQARGVKWQGSRVIPWMDVPVTNSGTPASISGRTRSSSRKRILSCALASWAARQ
ncbi:ketoacyl-ACP synthase III family protein [Streptomyces sp. FXJ1.4098]|nr:ketoacyl-ACP synthase III family protein [Streptomyces sp. FXJ1.4098]